LVSITEIFDSPSKKQEAEKVAKRVIDSKILAKKNKVKSPKSWWRTDAEITSEILIALNSNWTIPEN